jgi:hypothetical protein
MREGELVAVDPQLLERMLHRGALGSEERSQVPLSLGANLDVQCTILTRSLYARVSAESERGLPSLPTSLPRHRLRRWVGRESGLLRRGRIRRRAHARQRSLLLSRGQREQGTEHALAHDRPRQRVAQRGDGVDDLGGEIEQPQDLRHPRPGDPELAREGGPRRALPILQGPLPLLRQGDGIAVLLGGARWPCRRLEASGRRRALELVGEPRCSPRRQRGAGEEY